MAVITITRAVNMVARRVIFYTATETQAPEYVRGVAPTLVTSWGFGTYGVWVDYPSEDRVTRRITFPWAQVYEVEEVTNRHDPAF